MRAHLMEKSHQIAPAFVVSGYERSAREILRDQ